MLKVNFYKNKRQGDKNYGKIYARVKPTDVAGIIAEYKAEGGAA